MKQGFLILGLFLAACQSNTYSETTNEIGLACETALHTLSEITPVEGHMILAYKTDDGKQYAFGWPEGSSGDVDVVCEVNIDNRLITKMMVDKKHADGNETREDLLPQIPQELRTF